MANILNIETSSKKCSVALSQNGGIEIFREDDECMNHAVRLAPFVEECMQELTHRGEKLDAVAISLGPGSYTGLRIGLSFAKGLAFSLDIPLIGISTLQIMAVKAMFKKFDWEGDEIIVPMVDARRMEVFTGAFDFSLNEIVKEKAEILSEESFNMLHTKRKIIFLGDGSIKFQDTYSGGNAEWLGDLMPNARDMMALSEKYLREKRFIDVAYSVPNYLKEYQATTPKNKIINF